MKSIHDIANEQHDVTAQAQRVEIVDESGAPVSIGTSSYNYIQKFGCAIGLLLTVKA